MFLFRYAKNKDDQGWEVKINLFTMMVCWFFKIKTKTKRKERQTALYNENVKTDIDKESAKPNYW